MTAPHLLLALTLPVALSTLTAALATTARGQSPDDAPSHLNQIEKPESGFAHPADLPLSAAPILDEDAPTRDERILLHIPLDPVEEDTTTDPEESILPPRIAVLPALVTIDGQYRTDLGTFVSDTIIAELVNSQTRIVFDASARSLDPVYGSTSGDVARLTPSQPLAIGKVLDVERVFVPVVVGQGSLYTLSARVVSVPSGRIERVHLHHARGGITALYEVVDKFIAELVPRPKPDPSQPRYTKIKAWMSEHPYSSITNYSAERAQAAERRARSIAAAIELATADPAVPAIKAPVAEPLPEKRERVGSILQVIEKWNFVVVRVYAGKDIKVGDTLFFIADEFSDRYRELNVTKLEGKNVIAEITNRHDLAFIRSGEPILRWMKEEPTLELEPVVAQREAVSQ